MDFTDEQLTTMRSALELPETADEAAIVAAVEAVVAENVEERSASIPEGHPVTEHGHAVDADGDDTTAQSLDDVRSDPAYQNWRM
jgi:hypothetical protein